MKEKTAVQWLADELFKQKYFNSSSMMHKNLEHLQKKALDMEKQQILNTWTKGVTAKNDMTAEQYYNETYKKD